MIHYVISGWVVCENRQDRDKCTRNMNNVDCPECLRAIKMVRGILERFSDGRTGC